MRHWVKWMGMPLAVLAVLCGAAAPAAAQDEAQEAAGPAVSVGSAILIEQSTLQPLFEKGADEQHAPASITKIMTLLLVMEELDAGRISYDDAVTASAYASSMGGSQIWLEQGETMTVHELLKATAVASANDAAVALAEYIAGTEAGFVELMNQKAQALGMKGTHFANCTGLDEEGHATTARDIATMAAALLGHPKITEYTSIWMDELRGGETQLVNTNKLVYHYPGTTGLKTGGTDNAGHCLCASVSRDGMSLISVVLGAADSQKQFGDSMALLDWGYGQYISAPVELPPSLLPELRVTRGVSETVGLYADPPAAVILPRADAGKLAYEADVAQEAVAPVENNQTVGKVVVHVDSREICSFPVKTSAGVARMTYARALGRVVRSLFSMGKA